MTEPERRIILHVGLPKSGTTYLQSGLREHRKELARRGVRVFKDSREVMFRAALDVRGNHRRWGRERSEVAGMWERVCRKAGQHDGSTVLSHEILAAADEEQAAAARAVLARAAPDHEVHLVLTVRDFARQLVAEWQEEVKGGDIRSYADYWARAERRIRAGDHRARVWAAQDVPDVVRRWGAGLPASQVHLVTCPPRGADPDELWRRWSAATGLPLDDLAPRAAETNAGLGVTEIALLRRVNTALDGRLPQPRYGTAVKGALTRELLAARASRRPLIPRAGHELAVELAERWTGQIGAAGWQVHGDLADLHPGPWAACPAPDEVSAEDVADAAAWVIADLLVSLADARDQGERQTARIARLSEQRRKLRRTRDRLLATTW